MKERNSGDAAVRGLVFIGPFLGWEFGEQRGEQPPLGSIKIEGARYDGEPFWFKAWFKPAFAQQLQGLTVGEVVCVGVVARAKANRGGPYISYEVVSMESFSAPAVSLAS